MLVFTECSTWCVDRNGDPPVPFAEYEVPFALYQVAICHVLELN